MKHNANYWIEHLNMKAHPEGGYFVETYRSEYKIEKEISSNHYGGNRNIASSIFYLINGEGFSAFHRMKSDENWYFHDGSPIVIYHFISDGNLVTSTLGLNPHKGYFPNITIPAGTWFAAEIMDNDSFGLASCVVTPGFEFKDFELAKQEELLSKYPQNKELIKRFCMH